MDKNIFPFKETSLVSVILNRAASLGYIYLAATVVHYALK